MKAWQRKRIRLVRTGARGQMRELPQLRYAHGGTVGRGQARGLLGLPGIGIRRATATSIANMLRRPELRKSYLPGLRIRVRVARRDIEDRPLARTLCPRQ